MVYIPRKIEGLLKRLVRQFPSVTLTGPRQSGKSTTLCEVFGRTHTLVSLDDPVTREKALSDPRGLLQQAGERLIIDEIQYAPQLTSYLKILIDQQRHRNGRFILTGSQQFVLIRDLGDSLAGRVALLELLPFSLEEKRAVHSLRQRLASTESAFTHACLRGSFPEVALDSKINAQNWYGSYLQTYLERDVRTLHNVGSLREFQQFLRLLAARTAQILNLSQFANDLGVTVNTLKRWISILEASRIVYLLPSYFRNLGKRIIKAPKVYFLDVGFVCYLTGLKTRDHLLNGPLAGPLFENFVLQETVKSFLNWGKRPNLYYLRGQHGVEVDFLMERRMGELFPFEVKLTTTPRAEMGKPIEWLRKNFLKLGVRQGKLVSLHESEFPLSRGVRAVPLQAYLSSLRELI